jgi:hypothetical protein
MKRRMRPIAHLGHQTVFHLIDITIFDMATVVSFVTDQMLPESPLPDAALAACDPNRTEPFPLRQRPRKMALDEPLAGREIGIARRQGPDRVQVIGQHDERIDRARPALPCLGDRHAKRRDMVDEQGLSPLQQINREEPAAAGNERTTIVWHGEPDSTCLIGGVVRAADYAFGSSALRASSGLPGGDFRKTLFC